MSAITLGSMEEKWAKNKPSTAFARSTLRISFPRIDAI